MQVMEQPPVPSFKSFVRSVAPIPPVPMPSREQRAALRSRANRTSSIYSKFYPAARASKWARKQSSAGDVYQRPITFSASDPHLSGRYLDFDMPGDAPYSPIGQDAFSSRPQTRRRSEFLELLEPRTYMPPPPSDRSAHPTASRSARSSFRRSQPLSPPIPPILTPHTEALFLMTAEAMAASPGTSRPNSFRTRFDGTTPSTDRTLVEGLSSQQSSRGSREMRLLPHERLAVPVSLDHIEVRTPSPHPGTHTPSKQRGRKKQRSLANIDRASALRSHATEEQSPTSESTPSPTSSQRSSRLLSMVLDMYINDWTTSPAKDPGAHDIYLSLESSESAETLVDSQSIPQPLVWDKPRPAGTAITRPDTTKQLPDPPSTGVAIKALDPVMNFSSTLRTQFNEYHHANVSASSIATDTPNLPLQRDMPPHRIQSKDMSDVDRIFPNFSHAATQPDFTISEKAPKKQKTSAVQSSPVRASPMRSSPVRSPVRTTSLPKPHGILSLEHLTSFRRTPSKEKKSHETTDTFDYNRPIERYQDADHSRKVRNALAVAQKEKAAGLKEAQEVFSAIQRQGMPVDRDDPFRINQPTMVETGSPAHAEKGRGRQLLDHLGKNTKPRSKSQKRRDSLKNHIRMIGNIDPSQAVGVGVVGGSMSSPVAAVNAIGRRDFAR